MKWRDKLLIATLVVALVAPAVLLVTVFVPYLHGGDTVPEGLLILPLVGKAVGRAVKGIGKAIGGGVKGLGKLVGNVPVVGNLIGKPLSGLGRSLAGEQGFFKGVLPAAGLALGGLGALGSGPLSGLLGGIGSKAAGAFGKIPGVGGILGKVGGALGQLNPFGSGVAGKLIGGLSGGGGAAGGGGGTLDRLLTLGQLGLAGANVAQGAKAQGRVNDLIGQALGSVGGAGGGTAGLFADPDNPFKRRKVPQTAKRAAVRSLVGAPAAA